MTKRVISERRKEYKRYLGSKVWQDKRKEALEYYGNCCSQCKTTENLQVHHLHYRNIRNEKMADLSVMCRKCHGLLHQERMGLFKKSKTAPTPF